MLINDAADLTFCFHQKKRNYYYNYKNYQPEILQR